MFRVYLIFSVGLSFCFLISYFHEVYLLILGLCNTSDPAEIYWC